MTRRALVLLVALVILAAGCGVRIQGEPERIDRREVPYGLLQRQSDTPERTSFVVYFVRGERLVAVPRFSAVAATPEVVIATLLRGPSPDEAAARLESAIPKGTSLVRASREGSTVTLDLGAAFESASDLDAAVRQLETTMRELPGVEIVNIVVEGRPVITVPSDGA